MLEKLTMRQYNVGPYFCYRIPGLVCTQSGKLVACCESRKLKSDWAEIDIALQTSMDGGKAWTPVEIIARENLTVHAGKDGGITWEKIAEVSRPAGYSDIAISPDGKKLYIFFEEFFYDDKNYNLVFVTLDNPLG